MVSHFEDIVVMNSIAAESSTYVLFKKEIKARQYLSKDSLGHEQRTS